MPGPWRAQDLGIGALCSLHVELRCRDEEAHDCDERQSIRAVVSSSEQLRGRRSSCAYRVIRKDALVERAGTMDVRAGTRSRSLARPELLV